MPHDDERNVQGHTTATLEQLIARVKSCRRVDALIRLSLDGDGSDAQTADEELARPFVQRVLLPLGANVTVSGDSAIDVRVGMGRVPEPEELPPPPHDARTNAASASDQ